MATLVIKGTGVSMRGLMARRLVLLALLAVVLGYPAIAQPSNAGLYAQAAVFGIIGISLNVLMGYAGQISLGHNAFVGVGAFSAAYLATDSGLSMYLSIGLAALIGGVSAIILGAAALRIRGLYLALITLAYGLVAERSIFGIEPLTGGGAGKPAPRPNPFTSDNIYAYLCLAMLALVLFVDWRMLKTKFGRALLALKSNEQVASSFGMNPVFYKLGAFVLAGTIAGLGGGLLAFRQEQVVAQDFVFATALTYVIMVVVGGLGSRIGVVIGSAFLSYLPFLLDGTGRWLEKPSFPDFLNTFGSTVPVLKILLGALLLLLTITRFPGGIAQQLHPLGVWLSGRPFPRHHSHRHGTGQGETSVDMEEVAETVDEEGESAESEPIGVSET